MQYDIKPGIKGLIFDLDGTLVDTRRDIMNGVRYALEVLKGPELTDDEIKDCVGTGLHELIKQVFRTEDEKLADRGSKLYREHYKAHMLDCTRLYAGAREFLEYFKDRKQAVITNKPNPFSSQILEALGAPIMPTAAASRALARCARPPRNR